MYTNVSFKVYCFKLNTQILYLEIFGLINKISSFMK